MIWLLVFGILMTILGSFTAGVVSGPRVLGRLMPAQGTHGVPASEIERAFGRSRPSGLEPLTAPGGTPEDAPARPGQGTSGVITTPLLAAREHADAMWQASEPYLPPSPQGQHPYVSPEEWQSYVNAGRAVEPVRTGEHPPWTGSQPVLDDEAEAAEQMRLEYVRGHLADAAEVTPELMREVLAGLRALPVYGEASVAEVLTAEVLAAEAAPPFPYDPDYDNCAGTPGCGSERVFYRWYGTDHTACPRCWTNVFGGEPDPSSVHQIAEVREAERLAGTVLQ